MLSPPLAETDGCLDYPVTGPREDRAGHGGLGGSLEHGRHAVAVAGLLYHGERACLVLLVEGPEEMKKGATFVVGRDRIHDPSMTLMTIFFWFRFASPRRDATWCENPLCRGEPPSC